MKGRYILSTSFILSIAVLLTRAYITEGKDNGVIGMYLAIYLVPVAVLAILNGLLLISLNNLKLIKKRIISLIPLLTLGVLSFLPHQRIPFYEVDLTFLASSSFIVLSVTNIIWNLRLTHE